MYFIILKIANVNGIYNATQKIKNILFACLSLKL